MLQKLTRQSTDDAARDLRAAMDQMEAARDDLERGEIPARPQGDAIDKLEKARDRLDRAEAPPARELNEEAKRKLADQIRALRDRQAAAEVEAERILAEVMKKKAWPRPLQESLDDLAVREHGLGQDIRTATDKRFERLPVLKRLLEDAATAIETAEARILDRKDDVVGANPNDAFDAEVETAAAGRFRRPMTLALRRFDQLLEALKPDEPKSMPEPMDAGNDPTPAPANAGGNGDLIPPLAQVKVLRALQAELNERTAAFDKAHPNPDKLTEEEQAELKELEQSQRQIAELFQEIAAMFPSKPEAP
jgi:hypothetical protein